MTQPPLPDNCNREKWSAASCNLILPMRAPRCTLLVLISCIVKNLHDQPRVDHVLILQLYTKLGFLNPSAYLDIHTA